MRIIVENKELEVKSVSATYDGITYNVKPERVEGVVLSASTKNREPKEEDDWRLGWVSVAAAMPKVGVNLLCYTTNRNYVLARYFGGGSWSSNIFGGEKVEYWCYLPAAPRKEETK
jgi:hypothetical protein